MNHFINFIWKWTEGGAIVDFIITLLTSSTAENHNFTTGYSLGWRHLSLQNKFGIKKIKLVTIEISDKISQPMVFFIPCSDRLDFSIGKTNFQFTRWDVFLTRWVKGKPSNKKIETWKLKCIEPIEFRSNQNPQGWNIAF